MNPKRNYYGAYGYKHFFEFPGAGFLLAEALEEACNALTICVSFMIVFTHFVL